MTDLGEDLRDAMRRWTTGVTVVSSEYEGSSHGMTVNSFTSVSLDPPRVTVTLANKTRTYFLVERSGVFGVTILGVEQREIADRFAGQIQENGDRFAGLEIFTLVTGAPLLANGLAHVDCRVVHRFALTNSTLFVGEVLAARHAPGTEPLLYFNREYHRLSL